MGIGIDSIDKRILYHLAREARHTSAPDIAQDVDLSAPAVRNRISRLEDAGAIQGYHAHIDYGKVESRLTNLFMCSTAATDRQRFAQRVLGVPGVVHVREVMTGRGDLRVKAVGSDQDDLMRIAQDITALGVEIDDEDLIHREYFRPYAQFGPEERDDVSPVTGVADLAGDADVVEIAVGENAPVAGLTLKEAGDEGLLTTDVLVVTIERGDRAITPKGETTIESGDFVTVLSRTGFSDETLTMFTGK
ncbi:Lrp/AsnC family transcriptional regulator [Halorhabdus amylolytica]|uniref:Lrp/AsnC family transcriptional regulator n=1 Tax=Halorhabdus amylolytica TaxID=2559573 RepID=UPI0010AB3A25|nr:Lrp/AsnC family transcriptional regulator [Halorhabdus amylolytica]